MLSKTKEATNNSAGFRTPSLTVSKEADLWPSAAKRTKQTFSRVKYKCNLTATGDKKKSLPALHSSSSVVHRQAHYLKPTKLHSKCELEQHHVLTATPHAPCLLPPSWIPLVNNAAAVAKTLPTLCFSPSQLKAGLSASQDQSPCSAQCKPGTLARQPFFLWFQKISSPLVPALFMKLNNYTGQTRWYTSWSGRKHSLHY